MSRSHKAIAYLTVFQIGMGVGVLVGPHSIRVADHAILYDLIPLVWRGGLWIAAGFLAVVVSLRSLRWGWVLLSIMPAQRLVGHAYSAYAWLMPGEPGGLASSIADVIIWGAVLLLIRHLAGWPDLAPARMAEQRRA